MSDESSSACWCVMDVKLHYLAEVSRSWTAASKVSKPKIDRMVDASRGPPALFLAANLPFDVGEKRLERQARASDAMCRRVAHTHQVGPYSRLITSLLHGMLCISASVLTRLSNAFGRTCAPGLEGGTPACAAESASLVTSWLACIEGKEGAVGWSSALKVVAALRTTIYDIEREPSRNSPGVGSTPSDDRGRPGLAGHTRCRVAPRPISRRNSLAGMAGPGLQRWPRLFAPRRAGGEASLRQVVAAVIRAAARVKPVRHADSLPTSSHPSSREQGDGEENTQCTARQRRLARRAPPLGMECLSYPRSFLR